MTAALSTLSSTSAPRAARGRGQRRALSLLAALAFLVSAGAPAAPAQRRPRPALSEGDARKAVAATPGFELRTGAVAVREVSPRGTAPVRVVAEVKLGVRFERPGDEGATQGAGLFNQRGWRAAQLRTGDRRWEEFDLISAAVGAGTIEPARRALEELAAEFESREREARARAARGGTTQGVDAARAGGAQGSNDRDDADRGESAQAAATVEPPRRGPLRLDSLSALGSSAVGEVAVEAEFLLDRDGRGKWRVREFTVAGRSSGDLDSLRRALDERKAARARADLEEVRAALERYRGERGRYVPAEGFVALMDHLNPLFIARVVRFDPWHRPYLYAQAAAGFSLSSAGPDGRPGSADDVTLGGAP